MTDDKRPTPEAAAAAVNAPSMDVLQRLGLDVLDTLDKLAERHDVPRSVVLDCVEGFCVGVALSTGDTRRQYLEHVGKLYDAVKATRPTVGQS